MTCVHQTSASPPADCEASRCPLCGGPNDCRRDTAAACKGSCWCESVNIPAELLERIPAAARHRVCLCRQCVMAFHRERSATGPLALVPGDYYFDMEGLMVFTSAYHRRRGYCCGHDCRHCPYEEAK